MEQKEVLDRIIKWYVSDTIEFVDAVLFDSETDPHYSAVTLCNRIKTYARYIELTTGRVFTVNEFLFESGYTQADLDLIEKKRSEESKYYRGIQIY